MSTTIDDLLVGGAAGKGLKFETVGTAYSGVVVSAEVRAYTNIQTGEPEYWGDGGPKQQIVIGIQTDQRDPSIDNDDGVRYDYIKAWGKQKQAFRAAAQAAGGSPAPGDFFAVKFVGTEPSKTRGFNDTKLYEYTIRKANPLDAVVNPQESPAAGGTLDAAVAEQVKKLILLGLDDAKIASALDNVTAQQAAGVRLQVAANSSQGF